MDDKHEVYNNNIILYAILHIKLKKYNDKYAFRNV